MKEICDISYGSEPMQLIDLFMPDGECRASYIFMHGGGLTSGGRRDVMPLYEYMTDRGICVASVEYRMLPEYHYPVFVEDAALAAAFIVREFPGRYGISPNIFIGGSSAGGYLAMLLAFDRHYLAADGIEPEAFSGFIFDAGQPTTHFALLKERGYDEKRCIIDDSAALYHVADARPGRPLLFISAEFDMPARNEQNALMRRVLLNYGYPEEMIESRMLTGYQHCGYCGDVKPDGEYAYGEICADFILRHI